MKNSNPAILLLEDGTVFRGKSFGKVGTTFGEITFNTSMVGYQESLTDPSYIGQILVSTSPHIGNYGIHENDFESDNIKVEGFVTKDISFYQSRTTANSTIDEFMKKYDKVGIYGVDTRTLTIHIRENGVMRAVISSENFDEEALMKELLKSPSMEGLELSSRVSTKEAYELMPENPVCKVSVVDFGIKKSILDNLLKAGAHLKVFPMTATVEELNAFNPDGFMLSNGPGDPSVMTDSQELIRQIIAVGKPVFGICLGHQLLGLSQGLKVVKMKNGHRGVNHPVKNLRTGLGEITSQNHGFVISNESLNESSNVELTHIHLNDGTVAGIALKGKPVFSVQFHPEASPGPYDSKSLFVDFVQSMDLK